MKTKPTPSKVVAALAGILLLPAAVQAQTTYTWTGTLDNTDNVANRWETAANWDLGVSPGSLLNGSGVTNDDVVIRSNRTSAIQRMRLFVDAGTIGNLAIGGEGISGSPGDTRLQVHRLGTGTSGDLTVSGDVTLGFVGPFSSSQRAGWFMVNDGGGGASATIQGNIVADSTNGGNSIQVANNNTNSITIEGAIDSAAARTAAGLTPATDVNRIDLDIFQGTATISGPGTAVLNVQEFDVGNTANNAVATVTVGPNRTINASVEMEVARNGATTQDNRSVTGTLNLHGGTLNVTGALKMANTNTNAGGTNKQATANINVGDATNPGTLNVSGTLRMSPLNTADATGDSNVTVDNAGSIVTVGGLEMASQTGGSPNGTADIVINDGSMTVTGAITDAGGSSAITINAGEFSLLNANGGTRAVDTLTHSGGTIDFLMYDGMPSLAATDVALAATASGSTIDITNPAADSIFDNTVLATWDGDTDMDWDVGTNWDTETVPSGSFGAIATSASFQVVTSTNAITGDPAAAVIGISDGGWTLTQNTNDITIDRTGAAVPGGVARAVIDSAVTVNRGTSLSLQPAANQGADATGLDISSSAVLNVTGDLTLGGADAQATVNQSGTSDVNVSGNLLFGGTGGAFGGFYELDGGTLDVTGDIIEDSASTDGAQLHIDGGTVTVAGNDITVQRFAVGQKTGTTGTHALTAGQTLTTTGTFAVGSSGDGTFTATDAVIVSGSNFVGAESAGSASSVTLNGTTTMSVATEMNIANAPGQTGTMTLNGDASIDTTAAGTGDFRVADEGIGVLNLNGNSSITHSGGNFEIAETPTGNGTINMNTTGGITCTSNNFILGQSAGSTVQLNLTAGTIDLSGSANNGHMNCNGGIATITMTGGTIIINDDLLGGNNALSVKRWNQSGGTVLVDDQLNVRGNGDDRYELSGNAIMRLGQDATAGGTCVLNSGSTAGPGGNWLTLKGSNVTFEVIGGTQNNFNADTDTTLNWEFDDTSVSPIVVGGIVTLNGAFANFTHVGTTPPSTGEHILIDNQGAGAVVGEFDSLGEGATITLGAQVYQLSYLGGDGNDVTLTAVNDPVISIAAASGDVAEGTSMTFTLNAVPPVTSSIDVNLSYSGTASGTDYTEDLVVTFPSGASQVVTIPTAVDSDFEGRESVIVTVGAGTGYDVGAPNPASSFILDGATPPMASASINQTVTYDGVSTTDLDDIVVMDDNGLVSRVVSATTDPAIHYTGFDNDSHFADGFDGGAGSPDDHAYTLAPHPATINPNGFAIDLVIKPTANDLANGNVATVIWEIGGTTNGTMICLINGIPHLISSDGNDNEPSSLTDTDFGAETAGFANSICVPLSGSALVANERAEIAVIFTLDPGAGTGTVQYSTNGAAMGTHNLTNVTAAQTDWDGTPSVQIGNGGTGGLNAAAGALAPFRSGDAVGLENSALESGGNAVTSFRFWAESDGTMSITADNTSPASFNATVTIDGYVDDATSGTIIENGTAHGSYASGVWTFSGGTLGDLNEALANLQFAPGTGTPNPATLSVSIDDGGTAQTGTILLGQPTSPVYVDDDFSGNLGDPITDGDLGDPGDQNATLGFNAFTNLTDAVAAVSAGGTIIINDGDYTSDVVALTGTVALQLADTIGGVTIGEVAAESGNSIDLAGNDLTIGNNTNNEDIYCVISGSGSVTKVGTDRVKFFGANTYTGTTTVSAGFLRITTQNTPELIGGVVGNVIVESGAVLEFSPNGGKTITHSTEISGDGAVYCINNGTVVFDGPPNTFTGGFQLGDGAATTFDGTTGVEEGFVVVNDSAHLGTGTVNGLGSQLRAGSAGINITNNFELGSGALRVGGGAGFFDFEISGTVSPLPAERTIGHYGLEGRTITLSGGVIGAVNLQGTDGADNGDLIIGGVVDGTAAGKIDVESNFDGCVVTLLGASTYTGVTNIDTGTFVLNGTHTGGAAYTVDGATLAGTGSTDAAVTVGATGTIAPGASIGTLTIGDLVLAGTLAVEIDGLASHDQLVVNGAVGTVDVSGGTLSWSSSTGSAVDFGGGGSLVIIDNNDADGVVGTLAGVAEGAVLDSGFLDSGRGASLSYMGGTGNDVVIDIDAALSPIGQWRSTNFGGDPTNSGAGADDSDAGDGDGLVNLLEFGFGTDPNVPDNGLLNPDGSVNGTPTTEIDFSSGLSFNALFNRRDDHGQPGSVTYTVQFSSDLMTFHDSTVTPVGPPTTPDSTDDPDYHVASVPYTPLLPNGQKARFFRVVVDLVP